ncbi:hypothetical protein [Pedobacter sp. Hv1]|uniref:hypothetical protein n=1 Tax=Pedobacter sp. Hv1 TaxID=1740090 RepID=UPI0006D895DF|nr:hypothetical protein [Pedobacter sp. Hv1]KQB99557.1 hypothetical protein AQF98_18555 [Pedobacter sp. Hv1]
MKKLNLLSKTEMKKVFGGGYPPETPGGDPGTCAPRGFITCATQTGPDIHYFYACCDSIADARAFCPQGWIYGCNLPQPID